MKMRITIELDMPNVSHYDRNELNAKIMRSALATWGDSLKYVATEEITERASNIFDSSNAYPKD